MVLYNIHTHGQGLTNVEGYDVRNIINTYPPDYELVKQQQSQIEYFSCGIHPWYSEDVDDQFSKLVELLNVENSVIAVGEAGLDKLRGLSLKNQIEIFKKQAELAENVQKPVIIHCVKAWDEILKLKKEINPKQKWIIHGFRGGVDLVKQLVLHGFSISVGQYFNKEAIKIIPGSALFLETDDSDISILSIYQSVSLVLGKSLDCLAFDIANNVKNTFNLIC